MSHKSVRLATKEQAKQMSSKSKTKKGALVTVDAAEFTALKKHAAMWEVEQEKSRKAREEWQKLKEGV